MRIVRSSFIAVLLLAFVSQAFAVNVSNCSMTRGSSQTASQTTSQTVMMDMEDMSHHQHMNNDARAMSVKGAADNCCVTDCDCSMMSCNLMPLAIATIGEYESTPQENRFTATDSLVDDLFLSNLYRPPILS